MNLQFYLEKLHASEEFKKFKRENPDAYLCSAFFSIDKENMKSPDNKSHLDFYVPPKDKNEKGKMFSFQLEEGVKLVPLDTSGFPDGMDSEEISSDINLDFNNVEKMIAERMEKENLRNKIQKILFSLQNKEGKAFLIGTVFISMFGLLKVNIDLSEKPFWKITSFEKKSFFDMLSITGKKK